MINGWKRIATIVALALLGVGAVLLGAGAAAAVPTTGVSAGEFCGKNDHYEFRIADNGTSVQCMPPTSGQTWKWKASNPPPAVPSVSTSSSASASASASSSTPAASTSKSSAPAIVPAAVDNDELALTGVPVGLITVCGGVLLASGVTAVFIARRKRAEYRA